MTSSRPEFMETIRRVNPSSRRIPSLEHPYNDAEDLRIAQENARRATEEIIRMLGTVQNSNSNSNSNGGKRKRTKRRKICKHKSCKRTNGAKRTKKHTYRL